MFKSRAVQRVDADTLWLLMVLSFGVAVVGTRLYLEATGYPQIGNDVLHIAHVLWGGLLQFIALCVFLTFANRWTRVVSAILGGAGVGLFIDEVGKFITQTNDYFFPLAAPIIYAALLLTAFFTLQLRRSRPRSSRANLYWVLDQLKDLADQDFDAAERARVIAALEDALTHATTADEKHLTESLLKLAHDAPVIEPPQPTLIHRLIAFLAEIETRVLTRDRMRVVLITAFLLTGAGGFLVLIGTAGLFIAAGDVSQFVEILVNGSAVTSAVRFQWGLIHTLLTMIIGVLLLTSAALLILNREVAGLNIGRLTLILELTVVNLLAFYFRQFAMIFATLAALLILIGVERYRSRFLKPPPPAAVEGQAGEGVVSP